jgi:ATP synthase protein I
VTQTSKLSEKPILLSEDDKNKLAIRGRKGLLIILYWQVVSTLTVALFFWLFSGLGSGLSVLAGAGCYLLPNSLLVVRLIILTYRPQGAGAGFFLVGNGINVLIAAGLLWVLADVGGSRVDWIAALFGLIAALKGYWIGLLLSGGRLGKTL